MSAPLYSVRVKFLIILLPILCWLPLSAQQNTEEGGAEKMTTLIFPISGSSLQHYLTSPAQPKNPDEDPFREGTLSQPIDPKAFLERYGVTFPPGSLIEYQALIGSLVIRNTEENHRLVYKILKKMDVSVEQVVVTFSMISASEKRIQALERETGKPLEGEGVMDLWKAEKAERVFGTRLMAFNGVHSTQKIGLNMSGEPHLMVLNVTPLVSADSLHVNVVLQLECGKVDGSISPFIPFQAVTTSVLIPIGDPVALSHATDGKGNRIYLILKADLIREKAIPFEELRSVPDHPPQTE